MNIASRTPLAVTVFIEAVFCAQVAAQQPLAEARALYASAAYEDALTLLAKVDAASEARREAEQYRAFCLVALGRTADAERAIEAVVAADPSFMPSAAEVSPRILAMFADVRRRMVPEIARRSYVAGRDAFQSKDYPAAAGLFDDVIRLLDQERIADDAGLRDLRTLALGFVDLARAAMSDVAGETRDQPASAADTTAAQSPNALQGRVEFTAPVALEQELPPWRPRNPSELEQSFFGSVKVTIGADGRVQDASMVDAVHPLYDPLVLRAATRWVYRPATRDGEPVPSEKLIEIRLSPR